MSGRFKMHLTGLKPLVLLIAVGILVLAAGCASQQAECPPCPPTPVDCCPCPTDTPTPAPTATPTPVAPVISFTVDRTQINQGECVNFSWKVENVTEIYFHEEGQDWQGKGVGGEGTRQECPQSTMTYILRVVLNDNSVTEERITITVTAAPDAPVIIRFEATPNEIVVGECVGLAWAAEGGTTYTRILRNDAVLIDNALLAGQQMDCEAPIGTVVYRFEAINAANVLVSETREVVVKPAPGPTPPPAEAPVISTFEATPTEIVAGECVGLAWGAEGGATYTRILRNDAVLIDGALLAGQQMDCEVPVGTHVYRFEAVNASNVLVSETREVVVTPAESEQPPQNPLVGTQWKATNYWDGSAMVTVLPDTEVTAFFAEDGNLTGSGGCNDYTATYIVNGRQLAITPPTSTMMACAEDVMAQELQFLQVLASAGGFTVEADQLYLEDATGTVVIEFVAIFTIQ